MKLKEHLTEVESELCLKCKHRKHSNLLPFIDKVQSTIYEFYPFGVQL